ncbi:MAG TPA: GNAT family N-acetyltransferase [Vicinamibacteria bacterium]|nr:GNAT family N-acetyltransferase [Vicinamibacteria bacterium]
MTTENEDTLGVVVRRLLPEDLEAVIRVDEKATGRRREEYFKLKLRQALSDTGVQISLGAEIDGNFAGYLLARVYYGEFGSLEPAAVLDTLGVHPDFRRRGVGTALIDQLRTNLLGLGIRTLETEVSWKDTDLLAFFSREGFVPAGRLCLDLDLMVAGPGSATWSSDRRSASNRHPPFSLKG